ncbi:ABC transporter ATP-binding protein [Aquimonas voraii]|uniref:Putative ABC transport system ATP-binding protein n=1 Tax=Aquimonas voraii TaxID=265719 RepID=A0A1G6Y2U5_9GAMM|nr:ABC transporter ATP-binding protein [Aquimonas voraii]SDD84601.1 putative ABC transport system ATP-binding protein [Aquimonas voraii]
MSAEPLFRLRGIGRTYQRGTEPVRVLDELDLDIAEGEFVAIMGPSGSGKTTLLNLLAGIDRPDRGEISCLGQRLDRMSAGELTAWRARTVGFVFQAYNLLPVMSAARNIEMPLLLTRLDAAERRRRVAAALDLVGLSDCAARLPSQLSGGQQQRVAIARAIVADSKLLLCDEPTGNLDRKSSEEVLQTLALLNERFGKTVLMVTHDQRAAAVARRRCYLDKGQFVEHADAA